MSGLNFTWWLPSAVVFRLLLVLSLWQGPIPWGHSHANEPEKLVTHIARYHATDGQAMQLGWHWHLCFPEQEQNDPSEGPLLPPAHQSVVLNSQVLQEIASGTETVPAMGLNVWVAQGILPRAGWPRDRSTFSLAGLGSLRQMLCRMNC